MTNWSAKQKEREKRRSTAVGYSDKLISVVRILVLDMIKKAEEYGDAIKKKLETAR